MESVSTGKERCPKCAKQGQDTRGDNFHHFSDGHYYCFSCGYYKPHDGFLKAQRPQADAPQTLEAKYEYLIPDDASADISAEALFWLMKTCHCTFADIMRNRILYSDKYKWLIFPIQDELGFTIGFQARNFNEEKKYKWFTKFPKRDFLSVYGQDESKDVSSLVLVEDIVSAIRVGNYTTCAPLFGALISDDLILKIKGLGYNYVSIWLDSDKLKDALKYSLRTKQLGLNSGLIITKQDPKCLTNPELRNLLGK